MQGQIPLSTDSVLSIGLMVVIVTATWKLSSLLTEIRGRLDKLKNLPSRVAHIEAHLMTLGEDINNLFAAIRAGPDAARLFEQSRRSTFQPLPPEDA